MFKLQIVRREDKGKVSFLVSLWALSLSLSLYTHSLSPSHITSPSFSVFHIHWPPITSFSLCHPLREAGTKYVCVCVCVCVCVLGLSRILFFGLRSFGEKYSKVFEASWSVSFICPFVSISPVSVPLLHYCTHTHTSTHNKQQYPSENNK